MKKKNIATSILLKTSEEPFARMDKTVKKLQRSIAACFTAVENTGFQSKRWRRKEGGGGLSMYMQDGQIFEKAAVHYSSIFGAMSPAAAKVLQTTPGPFKACGLSLIFHPHSPRIPTIHMNVRMFALKNTYWYGGGADLTPYYPHEEDFVYFHKTLADGWKDIDAKFYAKCKKKCDEYFFLPHRKEMRGVGGVFFDHLFLSNDVDYRLTAALGHVFCDSYFPLVEKRKKENYSKEEKTFQAFRHGRYVEFNLLYDRGTHFGLAAGGRVESILSSLPKQPQFLLNDPTDKPFAKKMMKYYQPKKWVL